MTFAANVELYSSKPIAIIEIAFDGGTEYFASGDLELDTGGGAVRFCSGRVISFGSISRSVSDIDGNFQISDVRTTLSNADGKFSSYDVELFINRVVTYKVGFEGDDLTEFQSVYVGTIYDFEYADDQLIISVQDYTSTLLEADFGHYISATDWPRAGMGASGSKMPIIYGSIKGEDYLENQTVVGGTIEFYGDESSQIRVSYDDAENRHLVMNKDNNTNVGYLKAGKRLAGGFWSVTYGSAVVFSASVDAIALAYSTTDDKFLCAWVDPNTDILSAFTVSLDDTVITKSADTVVDSNAETSSSTDSRLEIIYDDDEDEFLVMYYDKASTQVEARAVDIGGGSISVGSAVAVSSTTATRFAVAYDQSTDHTNMFWVSSTGTLIGRAGSITAGSITLGSEVTLNASTGIAGIHGAAYDPVTGNMMVSYRDGATNECQLINTNVDEPETVGSAVASITSGATDRVAVVHDTNANTFNLFYSDGSDMFMVGTRILGGEIDFSDSTVVTVDNTDKATVPAVAYDSTDKRVILCYNLEVAVVTLTGETRIIDTLAYSQYNMPIDGISGIRCVALDVQRGIWLVAGHQVEAIGSIFASDTANDQSLPKLRASGITKTLNYSYSGGLDSKIAVITFTADLPDESDQVWCDVDGMEDGSGDLIENPITMIEDFITNYIGFTSSEYNTTTFGIAEALSTDRAHKAAGMVELGSTKSAREIIEDMARSFGAAIAYDQDGKLTIKYLG